MNKVEIIPAILPRDFKDLEDHIALVQGQVKTLQIDVCDGQFVPNATWPYKKHDDSFEKMIKQEQGFPFWENTNFEIDLMANRPEQIVEEWVEAGASRIILHAEAKGNLPEALKILKGRVEIGLALNIDTDIKVVEKFKNDISFVQCMGIDNVGFQGQAFDAKVIEKIRKIKSSYPDMPVSVDGGVSLSTAEKLIEAGADRLVVGSAIFESENAFEAIEKFRNLAK